MIKYDKFESLLCTPFTNQGTHRKQEQQQEHMETKHESFHIKSLLQ